MTNSNPYLSDLFGKVPKNPYKTKTYGHADFRKSGLKVPKTSIKSKGYDRCLFSEDIRPRGRARAIWHLTK